MVLGFQELVPQPIRFKVTNGSISSDKVIIDERKVEFMDSNSKLQNCVSDLSDSNYAMEILITCCCRTELAKNQAQGLIL